MFRHQLVHDAIYQHVPPPARRLLHREAAVALMAAGADRLDVADQLMLGAERGDELAVAWLREAAREASAQAPSVTVELLRCAEALLPSGHSDAEMVSMEVIQALLRAGKVAEASARAGGTRPAARRRGGHGVAPRAPGCAGAPEPGRRGHHRRARQPCRRPGSGRRAGTGAGPAELGSDVRATPAPASPAARRGLVIAEQTGDAAMTVWALTALMVAVGRQGRFGEALAHARRAAALAR